MAISTDIKLTDEQVRILLAPTLRVQPEEIQFLGITGDPHVVSFATDLKNAGRIERRLEALEAKNPAGEASNED